MTGNDLNVRFWGVRGSYPVPGKSTLHYGGNTACIEIRAHGHIIILDAGTGIIALGNHLMKETTASSQPVTLNLLFSHTHHDHIQGLPFFRPAYLPETTMNIYGPRSCFHDFAQILKQPMEPQYSPIEMEELNATLNMYSISDKHCLVFSQKSLNPERRDAKEPRFDPKTDVLIKLQRSYAHPKIGTFVFRIEANHKSVVYATDTEGYIGGDTRLIEFASGTDLLIHDTQYEPEQYLISQGFGHSTYEMATQVAKRADAKQLVLFHHDPSHDDEKIKDMESRAQELFPDTTAGREGLEFAL
jgi:phosphoribosyl 1,2-cyclic phosphodiesterase